MPEHPVLILADYYLATFLKQPTWVEDLRPFRAVMMPLDLPAQHSDIDRFIPQDGAGASWIAHARAAYAFDMASAVRRALKDLRLDHGRVAFDDMGFGFRLEVEGLEVADGYDPLMFARAVRPSCACCSARPPSTRRRSGVPSPPGAKARRGAISIRPMRAPLPSWAALCAIPAAWCGVIRAAQTLRSRSPPASSTTWLSPAATSCSTVTAPSIFIAGMAARPGWWRASLRARPSALPMRQQEWRRCCSPQCDRARALASCRPRVAKSTGEKACRTRRQPSSSSTASACPTWTSSNARLTASRTPIGRSKTEWWSQSTCSTRVASTSGSGWRR